MRRAGRLAPSTALVLLGVVVLATGCVPMNSTARFAATWKMRLEVLLVQDRQRIRTDVAERPGDLPAATGTYIHHLRRGAQQRVLSTGAVRRHLDEMAVELGGTCDVCVRVLRDESARVERQTAVAGALASGAV